MSITDAILQDVEVQRNRDLMREHHNAITTTEVEMKFDKVMAEIQALENYISCFEREWLITFPGIRGSLSQYRSKIDDEKIRFINKTYMLGR